MIKPSSKETDADLKYSKEVVEDMLEVMYTDVLTKKREFHNLEHFCEILELSDFYGFKLLGEIAQTKLIACLSQGCQNYTISIMP